MNCDRCGTKLFDNETTGRCVSCSGNRDPGLSRRKATTKKPKSKPKPKTQPKPWQGWEIP